MSNKRPSGPGSPPIPRSVRGGKQSVPVFAWKERKRGRGHLVAFTQDQLLVAKDMKPKVAEDLASQVAEKEDPARVYGEPRRKRYCAAIRWSELDVVTWAPSLDRLSFKYREGGKRRRELHIKTGEHELMERLVSLIHRFTGRPPREGLVPANMVIDGPAMMTILACLIGAPLVWIGLTAKPEHGKLPGFIATWLGPVGTMIAVGSVIVMCVGWMICRIIDRPATLEIALDGSVQDVPMLNKPSRGSDEG